MLRLDDVFVADILKGRTAIVTGGGSGLGLIIAQSLYKYGCDVHIVGRDLAKLENAKQQTIGSRGGFHIHQCDVRDYDGVAAVVQKVLDLSATLDILVNNAAGNFLCDFESLSKNGWHSVIDIDLNGTFNFCKHALDGLKKSQWGGRIINLATTQAYFGWPQAAHAASAKSAICTLTKSLAVELGGHGIRINNLHPGPIAGTEGVRRMYGDSPNAAGALTCLGEMGHASDISNMAVYLCSPAGSFITGADLVVDGGRWLKRGGPEK